MHERCQPPPDARVPPPPRARAPPQTAHRIQILASARRQEEKAKGIASKRAPQSAESKAAGQKFYQSMIVDSTYEGELFEGFSRWLGTSQ